MSKINIFWFRRDLRLEDNCGLYHALTSGQEVLPIFIFDTNILSQLEDKKDARVSFIYKQLKAINQFLTEGAKSLRCFYGPPLQIWKNIIKDYQIDSVYTNRDYEPYALERDQAVGSLLKENGIQFKTYKDQVIFEKSEVLSGKEEPYTVFTPYSKKWKSLLNDASFQKYDSESLIQHFVNSQHALPTLAELGFETSQIEVPSYDLSEQTIKSYSKNRNIPSKSGTSRLSPHLRFGTISVREVCRRTHEISEAFLNEIIWRDFYAQVLYHFPHVEHHNFRRKYDAIQWLNDEKDFENWCKGTTGFPIVDAGMRELNATGWMHNRVRMITASFLCKDLLIDWRWGEAYFANKLLDFDLASNNGGWQWAAGTGTDAAPYFRIFNPESQLKKFDPSLQYVKKWIPEFGTSNYPAEMVDHKFARQRALDTYKSALNTEAS